VHVVLAGQAAIASGTHMRVANTIDSILTMIRYKSCLKRGRWGDDEMKEGASVMRRRQRGVTAAMGRERIRG